MSDLLRIFIAFLLVILRLPFYFIGWIGSVFQAMDSFIVKIIEHIL